MKESILFVKSKAFALRIVRLYQYLRDNHESVIAKQMLRSGTSIGANVAESRYAQSKQDFISKLQIALKEASETEYWLELLRDSNLVENGSAFECLAFRAELNEAELREYQHARAQLAQDGFSCLSTCGKGGT